MGLTMCVGRTGAMIGNLLFSVLLNVGCMGPFVFVGGFLLGEYAKNCVSEFFMRLPSSSI